MKLIIPIVLFIVIYLIIEFFYLWYLNKNISNKKFTDNGNSILIVYGDSINLFRLVETYIESNILDNIHNKYQTMNILNFKKNMDKIDKNTIILFWNSDVISLDKTFCKEVIRHFPFTNASYNINNYYKDEYTKLSNYQLETITKNNTSFEKNNFFKNFINKEIIIKDKNGSESRNIKTSILKYPSQLDSLTDIQYITPFINNSSVIEIGVIKSLSGNIYFSDMKLWKNHYKTIEKNNKRFKKVLELFNNELIKQNIQNDILNIIKQMEKKFGIIRFEYIYSHSDKSYYFIDMADSPTACKYSMLYNLFNVNSADEIFNIIFS